MNQFVFKAKFAIVIVLMLVVFSGCDITANPDAPISESVEKTALNSDLPYQNQLTLHRDIPADTSGVWVSANDASIAAVITTSGSIISGGFIIDDPKSETAHMDITEYYEGPMAQMEYRNILQMANILFYGLTRDRTKRIQRILSVTLVCFS